MRGCALDAGIVEVITFLLGANLKFFRSAGLENCYQYHFYNLVGQAYFKENKSEEKFEK